MNIATLTIRRAEPAEAPALSQLALRSKAFWGYSAEFMAACRAELTYSPDDFDHTLFVVAEQAGSLLGFYALARLSAGEVELEALFIEPAYIGQGVGRALMAHAKNTARGLGAQMMTVQADPNATGFYLAAGGEVTGEQESGSIPGRLLPTLAIRLGVVDEGP